MMQSENQDYDGALKHSIVCLALSGKAISDLYSLGLKQEKPPSWLVKLPLWRSSLQKMQDQLYGSITKSKETK